MTISDSAERSDGYMLDTTEFDAVAKGELPIFATADRRVFDTHVQSDEIDRTKCEQMRAKLRAAFEVIAAESLPTQSSVWGDSR
jgi:hypothetical protein